jgi:serine/threonine protein kinase
MDLSNAEIIHRDIKLENIFLSDSNIEYAVPKLGDFGLATVAQVAAQN